MRTRAPDLANQYMGVSKESDFVPNSMTQGDTLDRCSTLPGLPTRNTLLAKTSAKSVGIDCCNLPQQTSM